MRLWPSARRVAEPPSPLGKEALEMSPGDGASFSISTLSQLRPESALVAIAAMESGLVVTCGPRIRGGIWIGAGTT